VHRVELNDDQLDAVDRIRAWYRWGGETGPFVLGGYAGTGKTTVTAALPDLLGLAGDEVLFLTPTNQACRVLRGKLAAADPGGRARSVVTTVARYLYENTAVHCAVCPAYGREEDEADCHTGLRGCCRLVQDPIDSPVRAPLVVVDEASMVRRDDDEHLRRACPRLVYVGDPGQLPPVDAANPDFSVVREQDATLTRIMRQGEGSEILTLAQAVRQGRPIPAPLDPRSGEVRTLPPGSWPPWRWREADGAECSLDAVVVQTNRARRWVNAHRREHLGLDPTTGPAPGDVLQATRRVNRGAITNGMLLRVVETDGPELLLESVDDGRRHVVTLGSTSVDADGARFNYGYAFTAHKAQGSEWDRVLVYPRQNGRMSPQEYARWLYTAVTRARRLLVLSGG